MEPVTFEIKKYETLLMDKTGNPEDGFNQITLHGSIQLATLREINVELQFVSQTTLDYFRSIFSEEESSHMGSISFNTSDDAVKGRVTLIKSQYLSYYQLISTEKPVYCDLYTLKESSTTWVWEIVLRTGTEYPGDFENPLPKRPGLLVRPGRPEA